MNYFHEVYGGQLTELYGGSRISYTFHDLFSRALDAISPFDNLSDNDIRTAIRNATVHQLTYMYFSPMN